MMEENRSQKRIAVVIKISLSCNEFDFLLFILPGIIITFPGKKTRAFYEQNISYVFF
jgi:hypothetical protein